MKPELVEALDFVLAMEGDYTNDPSDPGGETKYGISSKSYPDLDIKNLTIENAIQIYQDDFWERCRCGELPRPFAIALFDMAVNQGVTTAIKTMQAALGVVSDGLIGPKTIAAAQSASNRTLKKFLGERLALYARIMAAKPALLKYALNWSFRVISLAEVIFSPPSTKAVA